MSPNTKKYLSAILAIALVPGNWIGSVGTAGEIKIAVDRRIAIFCEIEDNDALAAAHPALRDWVPTDGMPALARFCRG